MFHLFSNNIFSPYHVSGHVLGPGEMVVPKTDTICPLRNEPLRGESRKKGGDANTRCDDGKPST